MFLKDSPMGPVRESRFVAPAQSKPGFRVNCTQNPIDTRLAMRKAPLFCFWLWRRGSSNGPLESGNDAYSQVKFIM